MAWFCTHAHTHIIKPFGCTAKSFLPVGLKKFRGLLIVAMGNHYWRLLSSGKYDPSCVRGDKLHRIFSRKENVAQGKQGGGV